jgi:hypothetical protein
MLKGTQLDFLLQKFILNKFFTLLFEAGLSFVGDEAGPVIVSSRPYGAETSAYRKIQRANKGPNTTRLNHCQRGYFGSLEQLQQQMTKKPNLCQKG